MRAYKTTPTRNKIISFLAYIPNKSNKKVKLNSYFYPNFNLYFTGQIRKMATQFAKPIQYYLNLSDDLLHLNHY